MRTWDLHTPTAKLRQALKDLKASSARISDTWQDQKAQEIEHAFIEPLEPLIRSLILSIAELDEVLAKAEKVCGSDYE